MNSYKEISKTEVSFIIVTTSKYFINEKDLT